MLNIGLVDIYRNISFQKIPEYIFVFVDLVVIVLALMRLILNQQPSKYTFNV
jgi:hypothetical protein